MKDIEIIKNCLNGNYKDFDLLVKKYQKNVLLTAVSISQNMQEAEDISQESFIKAFKSLNKFNVEKNFKNWLLSITYRTGIDTYRKKRSFLNLLNFTKQERKNTVNPGYKSLEDSEIFSAFLKTLNIKERTALSLQINENYTAKEISMILKCSESTVRVYIFNAKKKIKKIMEKDDG